MTTLDTTTLGLPRVIRHPYANGLEYFVYPSKLAESVWLFSRCFGLSSHTKDFIMGDEVSSDYWRVRHGYLLHLVLQGSFWHRVAGRTHVANAGDACLIDLSSEKVSMGSHGNTRVKIHWVCIDGHTASRLFSELRADFDPLFKGIDKRRMASLFRKLMQLGESDPAAIEPEIAGTLTHMLALLFAVRAPLAGLPGMTATQTFPDNLRRALEYICKFFDQSIPIKRLAYNTGQTPEQLSRVFRRELNMTPTEFLTHFRIEQAKRMLTDTRKPVSQIARAVGFPDENYFTRIFRKLTGQTPSRYRLDPMENLDP